MAMECKCQEVSASSESPLVQPGRRKGMISFRRLVKDFEYTLSSSVSWLYLTNVQIMLQRIPLVSQTELQNTLVFYEIAYLTTVNIESLG